MPQAWNIAAAWSNLAGNATLGASSEATNMPVTQLQQEDTLRLWRSATEATPVINATFPANVSADTFTLLTTNLTAAGSLRLKLSATALGNTDIWDSTVTVDPNYKKAVWLASSAKVFRYMQIQFTDASIAYKEAGFLIIDTRTQFEYNYGFGANRTWVDPSVHKTTVGGQTKIIQRTPFVRWDFTIPWLNEAQRWNLVEAIHRDNGKRVPVFIILDPSSSNLGRDSVYGLIQEVSPVASIEGFIDGLPIYSTQCRIDQRL